MNGRAYKVALYVGCVLGVYAGAAVAQERGLDPSLFALVTIALLIPAFASARALFVLRHADIYRADAHRVVTRAEGGATLFGGLLVAPVVSVPVLHLAGLPFWTFWDAATVTMLVGLIFTRFGCLMNGCCAGRPTDSRFALVLTTNAGVRARRYPTQLFEAALATMLLAVALVVGMRERDGAIFVGVVALYCAARVALQPLRATMAFSGQARPRTAD